jgi:predicted metal-dependent hydrolase
MLYIIYQDNLITFEHVISKIKHSYIYIDRDKKVRVKTPRKDPEYAKQLVSEKAEWILKKLNESEPQEEPEDHLFTYLGNKLLIKVNPLVGLKKVDYKIDKNLLEIFIKSTDHNNLYLQKLCNKITKQETINIILPKVKYWSAEMNLFPTKILFKKLKRRLGSCSYDNQLTFADNLAKLPERCIDYIIVHELAHIKEKNHSSRFWSLVEKFIPERKELKETIKKFNL